MEARPLRSIDLLIPEGEGKPSPSVFFAGFDFLALNPDSSVFRIVSFAWAGFGATFGPAILFALFWKRANKWGILSGMIGGGALIFIWKFIVRVQFADTWLNIYELLPAFILNVILVIVVSLITKEPDKNIQDQFDAVVKSIK